MALAMAPLCRFFLDLLREASAPLHLNHHCMLSDSGLLHHGHLHSYSPTNMQLPRTNPCTLCPSALYNPNQLLLSPASPSSDPTDLSHIVFAIGGSSKTWDRRRAYTELWWHHNHTRGHVWLDQAPIGTWHDTSLPYRISRDMSHYGNRTSASRIAYVVVEAYQLVLSSPEKEKVQWFVMGDDDTVFFVENLIGVLQEYDHEQMYYVGMPSESVEQDVMHSYGMAFGGGGFAISYPAVAELAGVMDTCLKRYASFYGSDQRIHSCLAELGIPLTHEPGFHQVDMRGSPPNCATGITPPPGLRETHHPQQARPAGVAAVPLLCMMRVKGWCYQCQYRGGTQFRFTPVCGPHMSYY